MNKYINKDFIEILSLTKFSNQNSVSLIKSTINGQTFKTFKRSDQFNFSNLKFSINFVTSKGKNVNFLMIS